MQWLDLRSCRNLIDAAIQAVAQGCPQMQDLGLADCGNISDAAIQAVAQGCPQMQDFKIGDEPVPSFFSHSQTTEAVRKHWPLERSMPYPSGERHDEQHDGELRAVKWLGNCIWYDWWAICASLYIVLATILSRFGHKLP